MNSRLISLDFFRGFTIAAMIVVNDPGSWKYVFAPLRHAEWHGVTPTDLVFPFFLFIVGVSIALSLSKIEKSNFSTYLKISKSFEKNNNMKTETTLFLFVGVY